MCQIVFLFILCTLHLVYSVIHPVILVPGDGGTRIEGKLTNVKDMPHLTCRRNTSEYAIMWLAFHRLLPMEIDCFVHNMKLHYDPVNHTTSNTPGVDFRISGFGDTDTIDWLDSVHIPITNYYHDMSDHLVEAGYERGSSLRGVPYDFRKAANEMGSLMTRMKRLIEETYLMNGNRQCVIIAHSLGNMVTLHFLNRMDQSWKDKYVKAFVTLAAPWGGTVKALQLMSTGFNFHMPEFLLRDRAIRPLQRSMTSTAWLFPSPQFWNSTEVLVETPYRRYTVNDYQTFFTDIDYKTGYLMVNDTQTLTNPLVHPGVTIHCLYGYGVKTIGTLTFTNQTWPDHTPSFVADDGDGSVNIRSLRGCLKWKSAQNHKFSHKEFKGVPHLKMLHNKDVFDYIDIVLGIYTWGNSTQTSDGMACNNGVYVNLAMMSLTLMYIWTICVR